MKVCLYFANHNLIKKSGIGKALEHQIMACQLMGYDYCLDYHEEYDILHVNTYCLSSSKAIKDAKKRGKKVIFHAHSSGQDFKNSFKCSNLIAPIFKKWIIHQYSKADFILTPTEYSKSLLESEGLTKPIIAISNGIDLKNYEYDSTKVNYFNQYFKLCDKKLVISVGLLFERKGLIDFIEVAKINPNYQFIWFGDLNPKLMSDKIKKALESKPENLLFPGYISGDLLKGAYLAADVFMFPSYEETEGIVVLEALAAKCNILVRNIGAYDGWLVDQGNCYMANSITEFDKKLNAILTGELSSLKEEAYKTAQSRSINNVSRKLKMIYDIVYQDNKQIIAGKKISYYQ